MRDQSPFVVTVQGLVYFIYSAFLTMIGYFVLDALSKRGDNYSTVAICTLVAVGFMTFLYIGYARFSGKLLTNFGIFILAFIVFHFGLFLVFSLGGEYNYFYLKQYEVSTILKTIQYEFGCVGMLFLSGAWIHRIYPFRFRRMNKLDRYGVYRTAKMMMYVTGMVAFVLLLLKAVAFTVGYYQGVRQFDARVPSILGLIEYFFIPFALLTLIYSDNLHMDRFIKLAVIIWSVVTAMCGDRTSGIAGIMILMLTSVRYKKESKKSFKSYIYILVTMIVASFLIVFIKQFRETGNLSGINMGSVFTDVLGELGSSFFPLTLIMRVCPSRHPFLHGSSYLYSILGGFIPESLDITGTVSRWNARAIEPLSWITSDYDYTFGTGYSLCAEAYANFSYFGFIAIFFIGIIVLKFLSSDSDNEFSKYTASVLMFEFFTLPRRNFYYIINHPFYCIVLVSVVLLIFTKKSVNLENSFNTN